MCIVWMYVHIIIMYDVDEIKTAKIVAYRPAVPTANLNKPSRLTYSRIYWRVLLNCCTR